MKKIFLQIVFLVATTAFADELLTDTTQLEQIRHEQDAEVIIDENQAKVSTAQLLETLTAAQNYIENVVEVVHDVAEEVNDITDYIDDSCDAFLDNNENEEITKPTAAETTKMQKLFTAIVDDFRKKGLSDNQIMEVFETIAKIKAKNFTAEQIKGFLNGLIMALEQAETLEDTANKYRMSILKHPATTLIVGVLAGIVGTYAYYKIIGGK